MNSQPVVSVIIPVYNGEKSLLACVESVISQGYQPIEIILINDGSIDSSPIICDTLAAQYPFIRVIHQPNRGVSAARNVGLDSAIGKYVAFLDADDLMASDFFQKMVAAAENSGVEYVKCGYVKEKPGRDPWLSVIPNLANGHNPKELYCLFAYENEPAYVTTLLAKRDAIGETRFREGLPSKEDLLFVEQLISRGGKWFFLDDHLHRHLVTEGSATQNVAKKRENILSNLEVASKITLLGKNIAGVDGQTVRSVARAQLNFLGRSIAGTAAGGQITKEEFRQLTHVISNSKELNFLRLTAANLKYRWKFVIDFLCTGLDKQLWVLLTPLRPVYQIGMSNGFLER